MLEMLKPEESVTHLQNYYFPPYITLAHLFHAEPGWHLSRRKLSQYQLQYVIEGEALYEIEGTEHHTTKGDLVIHFPEQLHSVRTIPGSSYICVSIVFHFGDSDYPLRNLLQDRNRMGNFQNDEISRLIESLAAKYGVQPAEPQLLQGMLLTLLSKLFSPRSPSAPKAGTTKAKTNIVQVQGFILAHFREAVTLQDLVRIGGYARNHLIHEYKKQYGVTPFEHIRLLRVEKAKQLALQTNMSIGEIARHVGYDDVHAFSKMFRKIAGTSLSRFCSALVINKPPLP